MDIFDHVFAVLHDSLHDSTSINKNSISVQDSQSVTTSLTSNLKKTLFRKRQLKLNSDIKNGEICRHNLLMRYNSTHHLKRLILVHIEGIANVTLIKCQQYHLQCERRLSHQLHAADRRLKELIYEVIGEYGKSIKRMKRRKLFLQHEGRMKIILKLELLRWQRFCHALNAELSKNIYSHSPWNTPSLISTTILNEEIHSQEIQHVMNKLSKRIGLLTDCKKFDIVTIIRINKIENKMHPSEYSGKSGVHTHSQNIKLMNHSSDFNNIFSSLCQWFKKSNNSFKSSPKTVFINRIGNLLSAKVLEILHPSSYYPSIWNQLLPSGDTPHKNKSTTLTAMESILNDNIQLGNFSKQFFCQHTSSVASDRLYYCLEERFLWSQHNVYHRHESSSSTEYDEFEINFYLLDILQEMYCNSFTSKLFKMNHPPIHSKVYDIYEVVSKMAYQPLEIISILNFHRNKYHQFSTHPLFPWDTATTNATAATATTSQGSSKWTSIEIVQKKFPFLSTNQKKLLLKEIISFPDVIMVKCMNPQVVGQYELLHFIPASLMNLPECNGFVHSCANLYSSIRKQNYTVSPLDETHLVEAGLSESTTTQQLVNLKMKIDLLQRHVCHHPFLAKLSKIDHLPVMHEVNTSGKNDFHHGTHPVITHLDRLYCIVVMSPISSQSVLRDEPPEPATTKMSQSHQAGLSTVNLNVSPSSHENPPLEEKKSIFDTGITLMFPVSNAGMKLLMDSYLWEPLRQLSEDARLTGSRLTDNPVISRIEDSSSHDKFSSSFVSDKVFHLLPDHARCRGKQLSCQYVLLPDENTFGSYEVSDTNSVDQEVNNVSAVRNSSRSRSRERDIVSIKAQHDSIGSSNTTQKNSVPCYYLVKLRKENVLEDALQQTGQRMRSISRRNSSRIDENSSDIAVSSSMSGDFSENASLRRLSSSRDLYLESHREEHSFEVDNYLMNKIMTHQEMFSKTILIRDHDGTGTTDLMSNKSSPHVIDSSTRGKNQNKDRSKLVTKMETNDEKDEKLNIKNSNKKKWDVNILSNICRWRSCLCESILDHRPSNHLLVSFHQVSLSNNSSSLHPISILRSKFVCGYHEELKSFLDCKFSQASSSSSSSNNVESLKYLPRKMPQIDPMDPTTKNSDLIPSSGYDLFIIRNASTLLQELWDGKLHMTLRSYTKKIVNDMMFKNYWDSAYSVFQNQHNLFIQNLLKLNQECKNGFIRFKLDNKGSLRNVSASPVVKNEGKGLSGVMKSSEKGKLNPMETNLGMEMNDFKDGMMKLLPNHPTWSIWKNAIYTEKIRNGQEMSISLLTSILELEKTIFFELKIILDEFKVYPSSEMIAIRKEVKLFKELQESKLSNPPMKQFIRKVSNTSSSIKVVDEHHQDSSVEVHQEVDQQNNHTMILEASDSSYDNLIDILEAEQKLCYKKLEILRQKKQIEFESKMSQTRKVSKLRSVEEIQSKDPLNFRNQRIF